MKLNFSERIGLKKPKIELEKNKLSDALRNSLWTAMCTVVFETLSNEREYNTYGGMESFSKLASFFRILWIDFFKYPIDNLPLRNGRIGSDYPYDTVRKWFF